MAEAMQKKLDNCAPRMQGSAALDSVSFAISETRKETGLNRRIGDLFQEIFAGELLSVADMTFVAILVAVPCSS